MKKLLTSNNLTINYDNVTFLIPLPYYYKVRIHDETGKQLVSFLWQKNLFTGSVNIELMRGEYTKRIRSGIVEFTKFHCGRSVCYRRKRKSQFDQYQRTE